MSFILDGVEIPTTVAAFTLLACNSAEIIPGTVEVGTYVPCGACTEERGGTVLEMCQVESVVGTEIAPTVHI